MKNVKLFYVSWYNINDTYNLFPAYLKNFDDLEVIDINLHDYESIKRALKSTSVLIIDHSIFAASLYQKNQTINVYIQNFKNTSFYNSVWNLLVNFNSRKVYIASGWDLHWTSLESNQEIIKSFDAIAWLYEKKPTSFRDVSEDFQDSWMRTHTCPQENWDFIRQHVSSRFELTHFVSHKLKKKRKLWDVVVPGVTYQTRACFKKQVIKNSEISIAPYDYLLTAGNLVTNRLQKINIRFRKNLQEFLISHSKITFVCGSGYNYPVRKFFEVPTANSLLLALPFNGFSDFGFIKDQNCVVVDFSNIQEQVKDLSKHEDYACMLANNLQESIYSRHNIHKRAMEFIKFIIYIYNGENVIAEFKNGNFDYYV
ncbi:MAG: glycosyltransferase family 1 protein [Alphaproteobacteria bacterium]|nr:glycosyltransferase family 1 protein [Alphaproteobacteria bacterium]